MTDPTPTPPDPGEPETAEDRRRAEDRLTQQTSVRFTRLPDVLREDTAEADGPADS